MRTIQSFLFIFAAFHVTAVNASQKENVNCIWTASEEVFRLMDRHEAAVMRKYEGRIQIAVDMKAYDPRTGISTWSTCGFEKYNSENGAVTKLYSVQLDRNCQLLANRELIQPRRQCPTSL